MVTTKKKKKGNKPKPTEEIVKVDEVKEEYSVRPELGGSLSAINEAFALKEIIYTKEDTYSQINAQIRANEQEIARISKIKERTESLTSQANELRKEIHTLRAELDKRVEVLKAANIDIPLNNENAVKSFARGLTHL